MPRRRRRLVDRARRHRMHEPPRADALRRHERPLPRAHGRAPRRGRRGREGPCPGTRGAQRRQPRQEDRHPLRRTPGDQAHLLLERGKPQRPLSVRRQARAGRKIHARRRERNGPARRPSATRTGTPPTASRATTRSGSPRTRYARSWAFTGPSPRHSPGKANPAPPPARTRAPRPSASWRTGRGCR